jgi:hypothetical protein
MILAKARGNDGLEPGRTYPVYEVTSMQGETWFRVIQLLDVPIPPWIRASVFEIVEGSLPIGWSYSQVRQGDGSLETRVSFDEAITSGDAFFSALGDLDPGALGVLQQWRTRFGDFPGWSDPAGGGWFDTRVSAQSILELAIPTFDEVRYAHRRSWITSEIVIDLLLGRDLADATTHAAEARLAYLSPSEARLVDEAFDDMPHGSECEAALRDFWGYIYTRLIYFPRSGAQVGTASAYTSAFTSADSRWSWGMYLAEAEKSYAERPIK